VLGILRVNPIMTIVDKRDLSHLDGILRSRRVELREGSMIR
jgi:hypothetical protein